MITVLVSVVLGPTYEQSMSKIEFWAVSAILEIMSENKWHWHLSVYYIIYYCELPTTSREWSDCEKIKCISQKVHTWIAQPQL